MLSPGKPLHKSEKFYIVAWVMHWISIKYPNQGVLYASLMHGRLGLQYRPMHCIQSKAAGRLRSTYNPLFCVNESPKRNAEGAKGTDNMSLASSRENTNRSCPWNHLGRTWPTPRTSSVEYSHHKPQTPIVYIQLLIRSHSPDIKLLSSSASR